MTVQRLVRFVVIVLLLAGSAAPTWADDLYGAIAYSQSSRRYGYAWGKSSREEAESTALRECKSGDAFIAVWGANKWLVLAHGSGTSYGWAHESTEQAAKTRAVSECAKRASGCHVVVSIYAGGQGAATLTFAVPANTQVRVGDDEVRIREGAGKHEVPDLLGGKPEQRTVVARMKLGSTKIEETVTVNVAAFQTTAVTFPRLRAMAELGPPATAAAEVSDLPLLPP